MGVKDTVHHNGYTINVRDDYQFEIVLTNEDKALGRSGEFDRRVFPSLREAQEQISKVVERREKRVLAVARKKLALPGILSNGEKCVIHGAHAREGDLLTKPTRKVEGYSSDHLVYPDVPWIVELVQERAKLAARTADIDRALRNHSVKDIDRYDVRQLEPETVLDKIVEKYNKAKELAEQSAPQKADALKGKLV